MNLKKIGEKDIGLEGINVALNINKRRPLLGQEYINEYTIEITLIVITERSQRKSYNLFTMYSIPAFICFNPIQPEPIARYVCILRQHSNLHHAAKLPSYRPALIPECLLFSFVYYIHSFSLCISQSLQLTTFLGTTLAV